MSLLTGLMSEDEMREERSDFYQRLREQGQLEQFCTTVPSRKRLWLIRLAGFFALAVGLALLGAMVLTGLGE